LEVIEKVTSVPAGRLCGRLTLTDCRSRASRWRGGSTRSRPRESGRCRCRPASVLVVGSSYKGRPDSRTVSAGRLRDPYVTGSFWLCRAASSSPVVSPRGSFSPAVNALSHGGAEGWRSSVASTADPTLTVTEADGAGPFGAILRKTGANPFREGVSEDLVSRLIRCWLLFGTLRLSGGRSPAPWGAGACLDAKAQVRTSDHIPCGRR
jgi:hypothetical protein